MYFVSGKSGKEKQQQHQQQQQPRVNERSNNSSGEFVAPASKSSKGSSNAPTKIKPVPNIMTSFTQDYSDNSQSGVDEDLELIELERQLNEEVDEDFFAEPKRFNTIHRVIDVLGLQMIDDATVQSSSHELAKNPAYRNLKAQQQIVEGAIEHMAVIHCADLNGSVIQVGQVARQFSDAVHKVRTLRKQVRDIQDTLGASTGAGNPNEPPRKVAEDGSSTPNPTASLSLRELWLKKLESEAVLVLLQRLDVLRAAPSQFDHYLQNSRPPRLAAAVVSVAQALQIMFLDDVAQVQALHKIVEALMVRKQLAEEVVWETLQNVVYLRTGNPVSTTVNSTKMTRPKGLSYRASSAASVASTGSLSIKKKSGNPMKDQQNQVQFYTRTGMYQPFGWKGLEVVDENLDQQQNQDDNDSVGSNGSGASLLSIEDLDDEGNTVIDDPLNVVLSGASVMGSVSSGVRRAHTTLMIPLPTLDVTLDLVADERRCMEDFILQQAALRQPLLNPTRGRSRATTHQPRYTEHVMALRLLVDCLSHLKRLDDVERVLLEHVNDELRQVIRQQQARTFTRFQKRKNAEDDKLLSGMTQFRWHLTGLLAAFGSIYLRLCHLAQILRYKIVSHGDNLCSLLCVYWVYLTHTYSRLPLFIVV